MKRFSRYTPRHLLWVVIPLMLLGCGSGDDEQLPPDLGLNGHWMGMVDRAETTPPSASVPRTVAFTMERNALDPLRYEAIDEGHVAVLRDRLPWIAPLQVYAAEFTERQSAPPADGQTSDAPAPEPVVVGTGAFVTDTQARYMVMLREQQEFGVAQRDTTEFVVSAASLLDVVGTWTGQVTNPDPQYAYPVSMECATGAIGTCVMTALAPARDAFGQFVPQAGTNNTVVSDITGQVTTLSVVPRAGLLFEHTFTSSLGWGVDAVANNRIMLSPDHQFMAVTLCRARQNVTSCELALLSRPAAD